MKKVINTIILVFGGIFLASGQTDSTLIKIEKIASRYFRENKMVGLIVGVINNDKTNILSYGETSKYNKIKPDSTTIFEVGEISYLFTSALLAEAVLNDSLKIDEPVQKYLSAELKVPAYQKIVCTATKSTQIVYSDRKHDYIKYTPLSCYPDPNYHPQQILLCDLATHTSGLPVNPNNLGEINSSEGPYSNYTQQKFDEYLNTYTTFEKKDNDFKFSNVGMALLGKTLAIRSGKGFEDLLNEKIISALKLKNTTFNLNLIQQKQMAQGFNNKGILVSPWKNESFNPAVGLKSNMIDMLTFVKANNGLEKSSLKNVFDMMHNSRVMIESGKLNGNQEGLSWLIASIGYSGKTILWQSGLTAGFSSFIGFSENDFTGIVILSNSAVPLKELGLKICTELGLAINKPEYGY